MKAAMRADETKIEKEYLASYMGPMSIFLNEKPRKSNVNLQNKNYDRKHVQIWP